MPFKSEKQRRFLHANEPEIAKRWERDYENEEDTHPGYEDTTWSDGEVTITMQDVENKLTELKAPVISIPVEDITHLDIHTRYKPNKTPEEVKSTYDRAMKADLKYPIIITKYNGEYDMILDGNHRLHKAVEIGEDSIQAKVLDLSKTPDWLSIFGENEEGPSMTIDDVLESGMEILGDYGAYEANLRGSETVDAGVESLKDLVEYYLSKLGLTDTDAEYYKKRHEAYQAIWDENFRLNKELLGHADRDERKDQEILNQRYNAMILAAMNAPQEGEETFNEAVNNILQSYEDV